MKKIIILFVLLVSITFNVNAKDNCDSKEFLRLKELAQKLEFDYEYKLVNDEAIFSVNVVNLNEDLKVVIMENYYNEQYKEFKDDGTGKGELNGFKSGERVVVTTKAFVPNWCSGKTVLTKTIKLPYYNNYYDEEKCKGNEDFKYCNILIDKKISEEDFNKQFENYLKQKENKENNSENNQNENNDHTKLFIIIGVGVVIVVLISVIVAGIIKRRKRNSL